MAKIFIFANFKNIRRYWNNNEEFELVVKEAIENAVKKGHLFYSLQDAQKENEKNRLACLETVIIELEKTSIFKKLNLDQVVAIHAFGFRIPWENTSLATCEAKHLKEVRTSLPNSDVHCINGSPFKYLRQIPPELRFLLFTDYQFFDFAFESAQHYDVREPGCLADLFNGLTNCVGKYWLTPKKKRSPLTLAFIQSFHATIIKKHFKKINRAPGAFRANIFFPLVKDAITKQGIKELLLRIQNDNDKHGIVVGEYCELNLNKAFYKNIKNYVCMLPSEFHNVDTKSPEKLAFFMSVIRAIIQDAINNVYKTLAKSKYSLTLEDIIKIIEPVLSARDFYQSIEEEVKNGYLNDFGINYYGNRLEALIFEFLPLDGFISKEEYTYNLDYSRQHACASAGDENATVNIRYYSEQQINELAEKIYTDIINGKNIVIIPPEINRAKQLAQKAIDDFNQSIDKAKTVDEILDLIDTLTHELELLHLFEDGNCRLTYLLGNMLAMDHEIGWSILYNPNRIDGYSKEQRIGQFKQGIFRFHYVVSNQVELLERNRKLENQYHKESPVLFRREGIFNDDSKFPDFALIDQKLEELNRQYQQEAADRITTQVISSDENAFSFIASIGANFNNEQETSLRIEFGKN